MCEIDINHVEATADSDGFFCDIFPMASQSRRNTGIQWYFSRPNIVDLDELKDVPFPDFAFPIDVESTVINFDKAVLFYVTILIE